MLMLVSGIGALLGALLPVHIDNPAFRVVVPWLLLAAILIFAFGPSIKRGLARLGKGRTRPGTGLVLQSFTAIYGGFFRTGTGIMMLATLSMTETDEYHRLNANKNLISILIASIAIAVFTTGGLISWPEAVVMIPGAAFGGSLGGWSARRMPQRAMRAVVIAIGLGLRAIIS